jgi:hypothetical protein
MKRYWDQLWMVLYEHAILEPDSAKLSERITTAEIAIQHRIMDLSHSNNDLLELGALRQALSTLDLIAKHKSLRKAA